MKHWAKRRVVINIGDGVTVEEAVAHVASVVGQGRVSTSGFKLGRKRGIPCYCLATVWEPTIERPHHRIVVTAEAVPGTDRFDVYLENLEAHDIVEKTDLTN